ncbi:MAG: class I SAM-dependent rRNA methyltransferase [Cyclobacteriaceae bacterium]|jgi:23S rRNA (cytosine1962-C5)-methyltransferase|nr:class I SAM-dependent rRNA methyltransferase [Cyclobacteriaceae bacterium]
MFSPTATLILKPGRDSSVKRFHPWVFSGAIQKTEGTPADGDWVCVQGAQGEVLGYGHYQKNTITVRLLSFGPLHPGATLYGSKIARAWSQRIACGLLQQDNNAFRLVHGEGDGLSGLIIDYYHGVAVIQAHSAGMHADREAIALALQEVLAGRLQAVFYKNQPQGQAKPMQAYLMGMSAVPHQIQEHGHLFWVDWEEGQKTGFFLDQRENRRRVAAYSRGRTVLNTFCYTGGFSVYALKAGAEQVHSVDASAKAIELTQRNLQLNAFDPAVHTCVVMDTFDYLKDKTHSYDLIILDPPAFAKHKDSKHQAMKGYQRLNAEAMKAIAPGGILFTFSCSQVVDRQLFYDTVVSAAIQAGREIKVLEHLGQPADHPVSIYHREGEYLKGLVLYVA